MKVVRRIQSDEFGVIGEVSKIIAIEAWKDPLLIPDLSKDESVFVFSDYSGAGGLYRTYSFYVFGRSGADYFNCVRKYLRNDFRLGRRRMSFKQMGDKVKLRALPSFLEVAGAIDGFIVTFAVDKQIRSMFADDYLRCVPEFFLSVKRPIVEELLRIVHFGAQAIALGVAPNQNVIWFTDSDPVVANERFEQLFGALAEAITRRLLLPDQLGRIGFGLTAVDDGSLELEDFASVPDLVAGALCEMLSSLANSGLRVTSRVALNSPKVSKKTDLICQWIGKHQCPLKKFGIVFDKSSHNSADWRPTFFRIKDFGWASRQGCCGGRSAANSFSDPVRFDIFGKADKRR